MYLWIINGILTNYHQQNTFSIHELHLVRHICKEYVHWVADIYWDLRASRESHVSKGIHTESISGVPTEATTPEGSEDAKDAKVFEEVVLSKMWTAFFVCSIGDLLGMNGGVYIYIHYMCITNLDMFHLCFFFHYRILITCRWGKISDLSWFIAIV
jgi:hypothetical protein